MSNDSYVPKKIQQEHLFCIFFLCLERVLSDAISIPAKTR